MIRDIFKDIAKDFKTIPSNRKDLKSFGITIGIVLVLISGVIYWKHQRISWLWIGLGTALISLGYLFPQLLKPLQKIWMGLAVLIGAVMSRVVLSIVYFLVLTPIAVFTRMGGKVYLDLRFRDKSAETYWVDRTGKIARETYEKQF